MLLNSLQNIAYFTLLKLEGKSIQAKPEIFDELITNRLILEKLRPLDEKLQYQIEKLTKTAQAQNNTVVDEMQFRPRPDLLEKTLTNESEILKIEKPTFDDKPEVYRPAKINPVYLDDSKKSRKELERKKARLANTELIREMRRNASDAPAEISLRPMFDKRTEQEDKEIERYEENALNRVTLSKEDKKRRKQRMKEAMLNTVRRNADFRIMEDIVKLQEGNVEKEKEKAEQNTKLKKLVKTFKGKHKGKNFEKGKKHGKWSK